jgi:glycosyltransferase involved in cell wall biosynthesis
MKISIVVPCFNEIETIKEITSKIVNTLNKYQYEILVIDDCSTDGSLKILNEIQSNNKNIKILSNSKNLGKGASLRKGFEEATGEIICIQDADLEYDPIDLIKMINLIIEGSADVVFGSRFRGNGPVRANLYINRVANFIITTLTNIFTNLSLTDIECCYKVFKKKDIQKIDLKENRFGIEPELTIKLANLNLKIFEVGISYYGRTKDEGKKIGFTDGLRAIYCIFRYSLFK